MARTALAPAHEQTPVTYGIVYNPDATWDGSATGHTFSSSADVSKFVELRVDGKVVDGTHYDVVSGSTKVTLHADWLSTLAAGKHTAAIVSTDGQATTSFTIATRAAVQAPAGHSPAGQAPASQSAPAHSAIPATADQTPSRVAIALIGLVALVAGVSPKVWQRCPSPLPK